MVYHETFVKKRERECQKAHYQTIKASYFAQCSRHIIDRAINNGQIQICLEHDLVAAEVVSDCAYVDF